MSPESVGVKQTSLVMGKHSGRHAFIHKLKDLGYELAGNQLEDAFVRFKARGAPKALNKPMPSGSAASRRR
jgi:2-isopropylmalate synthase